MAAVGLSSFYESRNDQLRATIASRNENLARLKAARNDLNARVRLLREELYHLQEPGSYVGEVIKQMGMKKVLVKVGEKVTTGIRRPYATTVVVSRT